MSKFRWIRLGKLDILDQSRYSVHVMNADDKDMEITLPVPQSIEQQSNITQWNLAKQLGLALGLTNAYLRHCISNGLIKIEQISANRYLYYLTPKGFSEKTRLTAKYLFRSFHFYRQASQTCLQLFDQCRLNNQKDIVLCGVWFLIWRKLHFCRRRVLR